MASGKTENYGLNQWEATDQVVRTDFNADNAKIDSALQGLEEQANNQAKQHSADVAALEEANRLVLLEERTLSANQSTVLFELAVNPADYRKFYLMYSIQTSTYLAVWCSLNENTDSYCELCQNANGYGEGQLTLTAAGPNRLILAAYNTDTVNSSGDERSYGSTFFWDASTFDALSSIQIYMPSAGSNLMTGCKFALYGLK